MGFEWAIPAPAVSFPEVGGVWNAGVVETRRE
jgi:hypothetical protein